MKSIAVRVSTEFDHRLRLSAAQLDMSRSRFIRLALKDKLEQLSAEIAHPHVSTSDESAAVEGSTRADSG